MRISRFLSSSLICGAVASLASSALAQEAAPDAPAPHTAPAQPPPGEGEAAPAEPAPAEAAPAAEAVPAGAAPAEAVEAPAEEAEESGPPGWFRIDSDGLGLQLWAGTTNSIGDLDIATDIYVGSGGGISFGEFDIGPTFAVADGRLVLTPMIGAAFDWTNRQLMSIVPQMYTIVNGGTVYFESWIQVFLNSVPDYGPGANSAYTRNFLLFKATDDFRIGPQVELTLGLNSAAKPLGDTLTSLNVGPNISYNAFGDWQGSIILYLGVETQDSTKDIDTTDDNLVGRFTYVHYF